MTTIEGLRDHPMVEAFVRADAVQCGFCTPGQIVERGRARRVDAGAERASEIRHRMAGNLCRCGTYPKIEEAISDMGAPSHVQGTVPWTCCPRRHALRLIRTKKEVEGRREEIWLVVDEDTLEQWPAGPLEVVGRPARRLDGLERARGEATYTADIQLPGMLHTAVLRSPHAHARVARIDLAPALEAPGVRGAIGPGDMQRAASTSAASRATPSPPSAPRRARRPTPRSR